ncbi:sushi domain-containing protein 6-like [Acipenser oxyrinchus oxyrinchus]|uniref:Sushi domain-containing protein 6-like n=1 Tax=Acipenser oxyrinchus oxyrinchus TaxID=40147 RepID=A0AAD8CXS7_ACIOX|nr:sushi domain-containing protein 6-like [Acipenser oxyrinchus oxyrinchus]
MCNGMVAPKTRFLVHFLTVYDTLFVSLVVLLAVVSQGLASGCQPPFEPENGGYKCHPSPCLQLTEGTVIEYFCDEGYTLKEDYKYLTCENGEWNTATEISCRLGQDKGQRSSLEVPTLSIVATTASSVALILLLVVLFVLLQPKLKSFHDSRRDPRVSGDPVSIVVGGVQVALPSYEEAVYGSGGASVPPAESRVQIVLSEDSPIETDALGQAEGSQASGFQHSETVLVHTARPPPPPPPGPAQQPPVLNGKTRRAATSTACCPSTAQRISLMIFLC